MGRGTGCQALHKARPLSALLGLIMLVMLAGCAQFPERGRAPVASTPPAPRPSTEGRAIAAAARDALGAPYRYGGEGPDGFDCSGLVQYAHARAGLRVPRTVAQQRAEAAPVPQDALQPGDLLFFELGSWKPSHVGIYLGDRRFIHSPSSGERVRIDSLRQAYWREHLESAGRLYGEGCCGDTAAR